MNNSIKYISFSFIALAILSGCNATTITSSKNITHDNPEKWADYENLPVKFIGTIPGQTEQTLAALYPTSPPEGAHDNRYIVMYLNGQDKLQLCGNTKEDLPEIINNGPTKVSAALCNGITEITRAEGNVETYQVSSKWIKIGFNNIRNQLYNALYPGENSRNFGN